MLMYSRAMSITNPHCPAPDTYTHSTYSDTRTLLFALALKLCIYLSVLNKAMMLKNSLIFKINYVPKQNYMQKYA